MQQAHGVHPSPGPSPTSDSGQEGVVLPNKGQVHKRQSPSSTRRKGLLGERTFSVTSLALHHQVQAARTAPPPLRTWVTRTEAPSFPKMLKQVIDNVYFYYINKHIAASKHFLSYVHYLQRKGSPSLCMFTVHFKHAPVFSCMFSSPQS